jgi:RND family efflux transporter MFP subunit
MGKMTYTIKQAGWALLAITGLIVLLLYLQGSLVGDKVAPGTVSLPETEPPSGKTATVKKQVVDEVMSWPGTVHSRTLTRLAPKVTARVLEVKVRAGDIVKKRDLIAALDDREVKARFGAARAAQTAAEAQAARASADARRVQGLFSKEAATKQDLDAAQAAARSTQAQVSEARSRLTETESLLSESRIVAPFDGVVVSRQAEPGDMAQPGMALVILQEPGYLRIEANIPAACAQLVRLGLEAKVRIANREQALTATVEEVAPAADPETRTVLVKAKLPTTQGLQAGDFGWLDQACGQRETLLIPATAVTRIGQLESVQLVIDNAVHTRHVRTGKQLGEMIEILSGLREGDVVLAEGTGR